MDNPKVFFPLLAVAVLAVVCFLLIGGVYIEKKYRASSKEAPKIRAVPPNVITPLPDHSISGIISLSDNQPLSMGDRKRSLERNFSMNRHLPTLSQIENDCTIIQGNSEPNLTSHEIMAFQVDYFEKDRLKLKKESSNV